MVKLPVGEMTGKMIFPILFGMQEISPSRNGCCLLVRHPVISCKRYLQPSVVSCDVAVVVA